MTYLRVLPSAGSHPCLVILPSTPVQGMVVCCNGDAEVGDGSWDGTLDASGHPLSTPTNQLALVFKAGPARLVDQGVSWFSDRGVIVVHPQSPGAWDDVKLFVTIQALVALYSLPPAAPVFLTGLSAGGAGTWKCGKNHAAYFHALSPIAGSTYPGGPLPTQFAGTRVWAFHSANDNTVPVAWDVGVPTAFAGTAPWPLAWVDEISGVPILDTHPDHPTAVAHTGGPKIFGITHDYTASFDPATGWTWAPGIAAPTSKLAITIFATGDHDAWDRAYGTGLADFNSVFWNWAIGSAVTVYAPPPPVVPKVTAPQLAAVAAAVAGVGTARAALDAANAAVHTSALAQGIACAAADAALVAEASASAAVEAAQADEAAAAAALGVAQAAEAYQTAAVALAASVEAAASGAVDAAGAALDVSEAAEADARVVLSSADADVVDAVARVTDATAALNAAVTARAAAAFAVQNAEGDADGDQHQVSLATAAHHNRAAALAAAVSAHGDASSALATAAGAVANKSAALAAAVLAHHAKLAALQAALAADKTAGVATAALATTRDTALAGLDAAVAGLLAAQGALAGEVLPG